MAEQAFEIDLKALAAEVDKLTPEQLKEQLVSLRARQKVATKKYYNSENAKKYAAKAREKQKLMVEVAKKLGIFDQIEQEADELADQKLAEEQTAVA